MTLVDGDEILRIISTGLVSEALELPVPVAQATPAPPACDAAMVRRTARQGRFAGEAFLGCTRLPSWPGHGGDPGRRVGPMTALRRPSITVLRRMPAG
jgi:hypothetical protein